MKNSALPHALDGGSRSSDLTAGEKREEKFFAEKSM
jgi:hypothetical protein